LRVLLGQRVVQHHIEQGGIHSNAPVEADIAELFEATQEEADAGPGGAHHLSKRLVRDFRNEGIRFAGLAKVRHQEQRPRQPPFAGVEELIHQIRLGSYAPDEDELHEEIRELMIVMQGAEHARALDLENNADCNCCSGSGAKAALFSHGLFTKEVPGCKQGDSGFFSTLGDYGELCVATLQIEDGIYYAALGEDTLPCLVLENTAPWAFSGEEIGCVECPSCVAVHRIGLLLHAILLGKKFFHAARAETGRDFR